MVHSCKPLMVLVTLVVCNSDGRSTLAVFVWKKTWSMFKKVWLPPRKFWDFPAQVCDELTSTLFFDSSIPFLWFFWPVNIHFEWFRSIYVYGFKTVQKPLSHARSLLKPSTFWPRQACWMILNSPCETQVPHMPTIVKARERAEIPGFSVALSPLKQPPLSRKEGR